MVVLLTLLEAAEATGPAALRFLEAVECGKGWKSGESWREGMYHVKPPLGEVTTEGASSEPVASS